jgi:membrane protein
MKVLRILQRAVYEWNEDKAPRMAAAVAFYTVFSLAPIVVISMALSSILFDRQAARQEMLAQVSFLIGPEGRNAIELLIENAPDRHTSWLATVVGLATMFFGATGVFVELKDSLNTVWEVQPRPGLGLIEMIRDRLLSFAMVMIIGFLLLVSLIANALLAALGRVVTHYLPALAFLSLGNLVMSFAVITFLFALIYKFLPDAEVDWKNVWLGAALTSFLFAVGKWLFGLYLGQSAIASSYGAAGSFVIVVLWTYYSSLILLFGAEVTQVASTLHGEQIKPAVKAVHVSDHSRVQQGIPRKEDVEAAALMQEGPD